MPRFSPIDQEDPMSTLNRMVTEVKYEDLPANIINYAKRSILDTMAVIFGGSGMEGISSVVDFVKDKGGKPECIIPFYGGRVPASEAGLVLGTMARAMDFGDVHEKASHCSEYTVPALLAALGLNDKVSGKELITAYVVGQEVLIRIGIAIKAMEKGVPMGRGSGHFIFGCVASVAKLLGLSYDELENSQGIARTMTQPHDLAMYKPVTLMVRVHHGFVCRDAINACLLSNRGITGPRREVLAAPKGYFGFAKWETDPHAATKRLGKYWEMTNTVMKPYTACKGAHTSISLILDQMGEHKFCAEDISNIHFDQSSFNWAIVCEPKEAKWNPQTVHECQFSLPYVVASAAYNEHIFLDSYTPHARGRRDVRELMTRISASEAPDLPPFAAVIHTTLRDGRRFSKRCDIIKGHPKNPFSEQELIEKFRMCAPYAHSEINNETVESIIDAILNLEKVVDVETALLLPLSSN